MQSTQSSSTWQRRKVPKPIINDLAENTSLALVITWGEVTHSWTRILISLNRMFNRLLHYLFNWNIRPHLLTMPERAAYFSKQSHEKARAPRFFLFFRKPYYWVYEENPAWYRGIIVRSITK